MSRILVVEDEVVVRSELRRLLARAGYDVAEAGSIAEAEEHGLSDFDLIISDLRLPGAPGTKLLDDHSQTPILIMTSFATVKSAVEAMKAGAADYISKPFDNDEMLLVVDRLLRERHQARPRRGSVTEEPGASRPERMIAEDEAMQAVLDRIRRVAPTDSTVLIVGESGTGKELVARAIHDQSRRAAEAFVAVNCAAIPDALIESELFGHEKGAFTGAVANHVGLVEAAAAGTLFLDEVGELPAPAQARLLRMLQEAEVRQVGSNRTRKVDVRIIAATHRDLPALVKAGMFREDLFFRLRVFDVRLPPLRDRGEDILRIATALLAHAAKKLRREPLRFSDEALALIASHDWPGNVRELENAIERAVILCDGDTIEVAQLGLDLASPDDEDEGADENQAENGGAVVPDTDEASLVEYFKRFVLANQDRMSETELAKRLGISRKALWERRKKLNLARSK